MKNIRIKDKDITSATQETDLKNPGVKFVHISLTVIMLGAITVGTRNGQFFPPQDLTFMMGKPVVGYGLYLQT